MSKLENETPVEIDEDRLDEVSGGPIYMQPVGAIAPQNPSRPSISPIALGDGSVKIGG